MDRQSDIKNDKKTDGRTREREMDYLDKQKTDKYINRMKRVGGQCGLKYGQTDVSRTCWR